MGSTKLTVLVGENLRFQNPIMIFVVHQIKIHDCKIFIYENFKKKKIGVRQFKNKNTKEAKSKGRYSL